MLASGPPALPSKVTQLIIFLGAIIFIIYTLRSPRHDTGIFTASDSELNGRGPKLEDAYLDRLRQRVGLSDHVSWTAWRVQTSEQDSDWTTVTTVNEEFHSNRPKVIDVRDPVHRELVAQKKLNISVPLSQLPGQVDASDFLFAISTSYAHIIADDFALIKDWARWITGGNRYGNGATFLLYLDQGTTQQIDELSGMLKAFGIDALVTTSTTKMSASRRYFAMIEAVESFSATLAQRGEHKKWFGILDEKIFLPNLSRLQESLQAYDAAKDVLIGLPSERTDWAIGEGFATTYGGGALFLSRSAVSRANKLPCFSDPADENKHWDSLIQTCLTQHTKMKMRVLTSFYSPSENDEYVARSDSYETGVQPLALHQYDERHHLTPSIAHLVTDVCGEACFLQRYRFRDNWVLVNGYTITEYPDGLSLADLPRTTAGSSGGVKSKNVIGPVKVEEKAIDRKTLFWTGRKNVWRLVDSAVGEGGDVWQAYVKRAVASTASFKRSEAESMDSVIVLLWEAAEAAA